jgi:KTSC domain
MDRIPVDSRALVSVGYDPKTQVLEAEFPNGDVYDYSPVSETIWNELLAAPSTGSYFMANIRNAVRGVKV